MLFLEPTVSLLQLHTIFSVMRHNFCTFLSQIFRLSIARMKINQIPYVIFQVTSQFSFKFSITLQCHDT